MSAHFRSAADAHRLCRGDWNVSRISTASTQRREDQGRIALRLNRFHKLPSCLTSNNDDPYRNLHDRAPIEHIRKVAPVSSHNELVQQPHT